MKKIIIAFSLLITFLCISTETEAQTQRTRTYLHGRFETGDYPTQTDYRDVFATFFSRLEDSLSISVLYGVDTISNDVTLADSSTVALVTEAAVKGYVDAAAGSVTNGDKGDITVASGTWTIDNDVVDAAAIATGAVGTSEIANNSVANADLATMATNTLKGNDDGGTATPQDLTAAEVKTMLSIASTDVTDFEEAVEDLVGANIVAGSGVTVAYDDGTGNTTISSSSLADGDKGDIDVTGSGTVWTIDTSAITTLEIQDATITIADFSSTLVDTLQVSSYTTVDSDFTDVNQPQRSEVAAIITNDDFIIIEQNKVSLYNEKTLTQSSNDYDAFPSLAQGNGYILQKYMSGTSHTTSQTIRVRKSINDGKTWTNDSLVVSNGATGGSISHIGQDSFLLFYWREDSSPGVKDTTFWRLTTDGGSTWGSENTLPDHAAFASHGYGSFVDGRVITNFGAAGTWIAPVWGSESGGYRSGVVITNDYGATWNYYFMRAASGTGDGEPELIVKGDSLVLFVRGQNTNKVYRSSSADGQTWSAVVDVTPSGNTPGRPAAFACSDGTILLAGRTAAGTQQEKYTYIAQSFDGGFTFPIIQQIMKSGWYTYGDFVEIENGKYLYVGGVDTLDYDKSIIQQVTLLRPARSTYLNESSQLKEIAGYSERFTENDMGDPGQFLAVAPDGNGTHWVDEETLPSGTSGQTLRHDGSSYVGSSLLQNDGSYIKIGSPASGTNTKLDVNGKIRLRAVLTTGQDSVGLIFDRQDNTGVRFNSFNYKIGSGTNDGSSLIGVNLQNGSVGSTTNVFNFRNDTIISEKPFRIGAIARFNNSAAELLKPVQLSSTLRLGTYTGTPNTLVGVDGSNNVGQLTLKNLAISSGQLALTYAGGTPTGILGRDASNLLANITIGSNLLFSSGTLSLDSTTMYFPGVTSLLNGGSTPSYGENLRFSRANPNHTVRYHSIFSRHSSTASENELKVSMHNGVTTTSQVDVFNIYGDGTINVSTGIKVGGAATSGEYLRGNGTNFVSSAIQSSDINSLAWMLGGQNTGATAAIGPTDAQTFNLSTGGSTRLSLSGAGKLTSGTLTDIQLTASDSVTMNASGSGFSMNGSFTRLYDGSNIPFQVNNSTQAVAFNVADNNASAFSASVQGGGQFFLHDSTNGAEVTTIGSGASGSTVQAAAPFIAKSYTHTEAGALTPVNGMIIYVSSTDATFTSIGIWAYENGAWTKL